MSKIRNGRTFSVPLVVADKVGGIKLIGDRLCRIIAKKGDTSGTVAADGVVEVAKESGAGKAWTMFQKLYWDATNNRATGDSADGKEAGYAAAPAGANDANGQIILNGLPAIWGD